jgi:hypothetical protein
LEAEEENNMSKTQKTAWGKVVLFGIPAIAAYALLFHFESVVIEFSRQGHWNFILPVTVAFVISYFHGGFTASFWDALGVKAKK